MKRILLTIYALILSVFAYSQTVLENPKTGMSTAFNVKIEKIELRDTATVLWFHVNQTPGAWISVPGGSFIQTLGSKEKLYIVSTEGIKMNEQFIMPSSGETNYKLFFPKLDASASKIDFGEDNEGGSWFIYDIQLKPELFKSLVPQQITGNWFRSDNAQWEISLFDSVAIYKSQVWKYMKYADKEGVGKITLKNGTKSLAIYTKTINDSTCMIGETIAQMVKYDNKPNKTAISAETELYKLPLFKTDTVTYCGYIKGFSPRFPQRTGMVYVNDVLTGEQVSYLLKIADDGTFKVKFAYSNPQGIFVQLLSSFETIFVEPGKTTFQLIDNNSKTNPVLFMGDCARLNSDVLKLKHINSFDYNQMLEKVADFSPEQYKVWLLELQQKDREALANFAQNHPISAKALQIKKLEIDYRYSSNIMEYGWNKEAAWRKKNNIPQDQREISFKPTKPDSSYYSFLTNELVNYQLAVLTPDYSSFINRLKFMEIFRGDSKVSFLADNMLAMEKSGYIYSPEDKQVSDRMKEVHTKELAILLNEFFNKYGKQSTQFDKKFAEILKPFNKDKKSSELTASLTREYLIGQNIQLTEDELTLLNAQEVLQKNHAFQKLMLFQDEKLKMSSQFNTEFSTFQNNLFKESMLTKRNENLQKVLGIQLGLATDIMASQDYCSSIVSEMTPVSDQKLKAFQKTITNPFIAIYIGLKNNETIAKIEANKNLAGSKVNEVPKTEGDKIFDAIMEKYKGKVVDVDFWATWCGPCRSGIEQIKPLKDEMANDNVAFVYITNQTSPKTTYDNMIPTIRGEHYRVSADEWNMLCGMFKISGIPHYVLVGKDGKVINSQLGHLQNTQLKALLMKTNLE